MAEFKNVTIAKAASIFYDGKVTSRSILFDDGSYKTLGIMLPGEYKFNTVHKEVLDIQSGILELRLPAEDWIEYKAPASFEIPANSKFTLRVNNLVDYCCSFIKH